MVNSCSVIFGVGAVADHAAVFDGDYTAFEFVDDFLIVRG